MKIVDPKNITMTKISPISGKKSLVDKLFSISEIVITFFFMVAEFIIGIGSLLLIIIYAIQIFIFNNHQYINRAQLVLELLSKYWIGFLFVIAFIFFRIILIKLTHLRNVKDGQFDPGKKIYSKQD
jgi:hypothetical protein